MLTPEDVAEIRRIVREEVSAGSNPHPSPAHADEALEAALAAALGPQEIRTPALVGVVLETPDLLAHVTRRLGARPLNEQTLGALLSRLRRLPGSRIRRRHSDGGLWRVVAP